jgi:hypothetical protein
MAGIFIRDRIELNTKFLDKIAQGTKDLPPGSTVTLAARELVFGRDASSNGLRLTLVDRSLLILADRLDIGNGQIVVSSQAGIPGPAGEPGLPAATAIQPGRIGQNGQLGGDGSAGLNVTILCKQLISIQVAANGAPGGPGGRGGEGGAGGAGIPSPEPPVGLEGPDPPPPPPPPVPGGNGGEGGNGGNGGRGGNGGHVTIAFVEDHISGGFDDRASVQVSGGPGGPGGDGGTGGPGGLFAEEGRGGDSGQEGARGNDGQTEVLQLDDSTLFSRIRTELQPLATAWASYRFRVGSFLFRSFRPNVPAQADNLNLALAEFDTVLALEPSHEDAALTRQWLLANHTILGLPRDLDIIPDFPHYESVNADFGPLVLTLFQSATNMLLEGISLEEKRKDLIGKLASIEELLVALDDERAAAEIGVQAAKLTDVRSGQRIVENQKAIDKRQRDLLNSISFLDFVTTFAIVASAVAGLASGGASLVTVIPIIVKIRQAVEDKDLPDLLKDAENRKLFKEAAGDIKSLIEGTKDFIDAEKLFGNFNSARGDAQLVRLFQERTQLAYENMLARLHVEQAQLQLKAADAHITQTRNDQERAQRQLDTLVDQELETAALVLLGNTQRFMDLLIEYAFLATRSLEIYTLADLSDELRFDYGYIHPDEEEDLSIAALTIAYQNSWSQFVKFIFLQQRFDRYFASGDFVHDIFRVTVTDKDTLDDFKASRNLTLLINRDELPSRRFETKVESVHISLVGANANSPSISCVVEHSGRYTEFKRDGSRAELVLGPRAAVIQAAVSPLEFRGGVTGSDPQTLAFWGRGLATAWHLLIEPDEIASGQVDLSGVSKIEVQIGYAAFL